MNELSNGQALRGRGLRERLREVLRELYRSVVTKSRWREVLQVVETPQLFYAPSSPLVYLGSKPDKDNLHSRIRIHRLSPRLALGTQIEDSIPSPACLGMREFNETGAFRGSDC